MNKVYITHATSRYLQVAHNMAKSIREFSEIPIVIYCIDTDKKDTYLFQDIKDVYVEILNLDIKEPEQYNINETGNFYVDRKNLRTYDILSAKIKSIQHALDSGWDEVCYLDSDCIATPLTDELFNWSQQITDYPLATRGIHEYMIIIDNGVPKGNPYEHTWPVADNSKSLEWPLMQMMCIDSEKRGSYKTTNIILSNQNCKDFIQTWWDFSQLLPKITDVRVIAPYHEETLFNVLTWSKGGNLSLPLSYINLSNGLNTVKDFYNIDESDSGMRFYNSNDPETHFYKIPNNKKDIKVLHGEKLTSECDKIILYLKDLEQNGYFQN
jgi:hypothetical protein